MSPWCDSTGIVLVAVLGIFLGRVFSRCRGSYWTLGYFLPCVAIAVLALARCNNALYFVRPFCWVTTGRVRFIIVSLAISMGLTAPLSRLPRRCERLLVCILMAVAVTGSCVLPFLVPALIRDRLSSLRTRFDPNGVCRQTTDYTCGPAAAVTALRQLGLAADEGEIAVLSYSNPVTGTLPTFLCSALNNRYSAAGLKCQYRRFDSINQLRDGGVTLVVVKKTFLLDHCLAVLEVSDNMITTADPVTGTKLMPREQFEKIWRFAGIVLERDSVDGAQ